MTEDAARLDVRKGSVACALLVIVVAIGVLVGWATGNAVLTSVVPGLVAMNPLTAVCFLLCSLVLLFHRADAQPGRRWATIGLAVVVIGCGVARLGGYLLGLDAGLDRILFASALDDGSGLPNRMAPNTALCFVLIGKALHALASGRPTRAQLFAMPAALSAFIALIGYAYSVTSLVAVSGFIPMALHTAALFILIATAVLCATPEHGVMASLLSPGPGGRVLRKMLPTLVLGPPVLGWARLQGELAQLYGPAFGVALFMGAMIAMGVALAWTTANALDRSDAERSRADELVRRLAHFDGLTGLPNRKLFEDRLRRALARAQRARGMVALLFLDLDGFKQVNDTLGHAAGDEVLRDAAKRIEAALRTVDTAARLGGDEFTVVLEQIESVDDANVVARRLLAHLSAPYPSASSVPISASVGVSLYPRDATSASALVAAADAAMYRAKRAGKNRIELEAASAPPEQAS